MNCNRRNFIKGMAVATTVIPFSNVLLASHIGGKQSRRFPVFFFTKPLDAYELEFMTDTLVSAGIDGYDLTVRPGGRVLPEKVEDDLPRVMEVGKKYNLRPGMMVTAITAAGAKDTKRVLQTAASLGIKHYRMGYYDYDFEKGIDTSLNEIRKKIEMLAELNLEIGIQAGYQNHSGTKVGSPVWDLWNLIHDLPVESISSQYDVRHAVTEGANSWILAMRLLQKNIGSLCIKDFTWKVSGRKASIVSVPLGEGIVDFDLFFKMIKELNIRVPISLHAEYPLLSGEEKCMTLLRKQKIIVSKIRKDVDFIHMYLVKYQLI